MRAAYDWNHPEAVAVITDHLLEGAHDDLGMPMACISEFQYPETEVETAGIALELAGGGRLSTWQGERL